MEQIFENGDWYGEGEIGSNNVRLLTIRELNESL